MEAIIIKIDFGTLAFGFHIKSGGGTPNWATKIDKIIEELIQLNIKQSIKLANTLINWKQEIINIIKYKINNGYVEGYNNKIKVIKRVSFGLRNYERFRKLIYLCI